MTRRNNVSTNDVEIKIHLATTGARFSSLSTHTPKTILYRTMIACGLETGGVCNEDYTIYDGTQ